MLAVEKGWIRVGDFAFEVDLHLHEDYSINLVEKVDDLEFAFDVGFLIFRDYSIDLEEEEVMEQEASFKMQATDILVTQNGVHDSEQVINPKCQMDLN